MMHRAYSLLEVKEISEEKDFYVVSGMATTPTPDRMNDVVEPLGAKFAPTIPLLWQHQSDKPVGQTEFGKPTNKGIPFTARLPNIKEAGTLKDRVDEAIQSLKYRLIGAVSIGFSVLNDAVEHLEDGGLRFLETEILELSLVTIPANAEATITSVKSIDAELRAASGREQERVTKSACVKAPIKTVSLKSGKMNISEQIKSWEAKRAATVAAVEELMAKSVDAGESLDAEEDEQYEELSAEVKAIDKQIARLKDFEKLQAEKAEPVTPRQPNNGPTILVRKQDKDEDFEGQNFTRSVIANTLAYLSQGKRTAASIAEERWGKTNPTLVHVIKAGVEGGGTDSGEWGAELATADSRFTGDFIEFLYGKTVYNQLDLRAIPDNVTIKGQDGAASAFWVGQSAGIPVTKADFTDVTLQSLKVAAIAVVSKELLRRSSPSAEQLVRDSLVQAAAQRIDTTFLSDASAVSGVSPAGLLDGISDLGSNGSTAAAVRQDILELYAPFLAAKNATGLVIVTTPSLAKSTSLIVNALGQTEFPGLNAMGGTLMGDPVVTGDNVPANHVILMKPSDIYKIGETGVEVSVSDQATIEQDSDPQGESQGPTAASANLSSMWQTDSVALKIVQPLNYAKRRASAVSYIGDAGWGNDSSTTA